MGDLFLECNNGHRGCLFALFTLLLGLTLTAQEEEIVAYDSFEVSSNLVETRIQYGTNSQLGFADPFDHDQDMFGVTDGVVATGGSSYPEPAPNVLIDRAVSTNCLGFLSTDRHGVVPCDYGGLFFGIADTKNSQNSGEVIAEWSFDVRYYAQLTQICLDIGAMGNFESSDSLVVEMLIDGQRMSLWHLRADETISANYNITNPTALDDPLLINGTVLTNGLTKHCISLPGSTRGNNLKVIVRGSLDGSDEAIAFDNLTVFGKEVVASSGPAPNCLSHLSASIDSDGTIEILGPELITNMNDSNQMVAAVWIENDAGRILARRLLNTRRSIVLMDVCDYIGQTLRLVSETPNGRCTTELTIKQTADIELCPQSSNLSVWCHDIRAQEVPDDEDLSWYSTAPPYSTKPLIKILCDSMETIQLEHVYDLNGDYLIDAIDTLIIVRDFYRKIESEYQLSFSDWIDNHDCEDSVQKTIYRTWQALDKAGRRVESTDTINVYRLPYLDSTNVICAKNDTLYPITITHQYDSLVVTNICWKALIGKHSDGSYIRYPRALVDSLCALIDSNFLSPLIWQHIENNPPIIYPDQMEVSICDIPSILIQEEDYYRLDLDTGYLILIDSNGYSKVTSEWFYESGSEVLWEDICLPWSNIIMRAFSEEVWEKPVCPLGLQIMLPSQPGSSIMDTICLHDVVNPYGSCSLNYCVDSSFCSEICPGVKRTKVVIETDCPSYYQYCCERQLYYIDTVPPEIACDTSIELVLNNHECRATLRLPQILVEDQHSGVAKVKMEFPNGLKRELRRDPVDEHLWHLNEGMTLGRNDLLETKDIRLTATDSCSNVRIALIPISLKDERAPDVTLLDRNVNLTEKLDWLSANSFLDEVRDNCQIDDLFIRRLDWAEMMDNLCSDAEMRFDDAADFENVISGGRFFDLISSSINRDDLSTYYSDFLLSANSGSLCQRQLVESWRKAIQNEIASHCERSDEHQNPIFNPAESHLFGGGWGDVIPLFCEDLCHPIEIEVLAFDEDCNYTIGSMRVNVLDQNLIKMEQQLSDVAISCEAAEKYEYLALLNAAANLKNNQGGLLSRLVFSLLDETFGTYQFGWKEEDELYDRFGQPIERNLNIEDLSCVGEKGLKSHKDRVQNGQITREPNSLQMLEKSTRKIEQGVISVLCDGHEITQKIEDERDDCGRGKVIRKWNITAPCQPNLPPIEIKQEIEIYPSCPISIGMVTHSRDTSVCDSSLHSRDKLKSWLTDLEPIVDLTYQSCRQLDLSYEDHISAVNGSGWTVLRNHKLIDWCQMSELDFVQKITIRTTCSDGELVKIGNESYSYPRAMSNENTNLSQDLDWMVLPSAFSGRAVIQLEQFGLRPLTISISDVMGKVRYVQSNGLADGQQEINLLGEWFNNPGIYFVTITADSFTETKRVIYLGH